jgi:hypothetical protein
MATSFATLQNTIGTALGQLSVPGAFGASLQPNAGLTTTALNLIIVANGLPQGLIKTMSIDENFNTQRVKAIGSAIDIALLPGVYEATGTFDKAFLYGTTLETALGGGIRPVVGRYLADPDFTKFYFNVVETNANGTVVAERHDCVLTSVRRSYEIDSVVVMENASFLVRWSAAS